MAFGGVLVLLVFLLAALQGGGMVEAKACEGKDLDAYSDLRVGNKLKKESSSFNRAKRGQWARIFYKERLVIVFAGAKCLLKFKKIMPPRGQQPQGHPRHP